MKYYLVITPSYYVDYDWYEPPEYIRDYCFIKAQNKREAKILAIKHPDLKGHVDSQRSDNCNPFSGLEVQEITKEDYEIQQVE